MTALSPWQRALRRKSLRLSLLIIVLLGFIAALAPQLAPHDPYRWDIPRGSLPPAWVQNVPKPGVPEYPLGTDRYGRDVLSRQLYGLRTAFVLAFTAVPLAALAGTLVGLVAGYRGGRIDTWLMLFSDMLQALPGIMFVVIIILIFRALLSPTWLHGLVTLVVGFAAVSWVSLARLVRVNVLQLKSRLFVEAAVSTGATPQRIIMRHLLPNLLHVITVWMINSVPAVILLEAVLGYIGVGLTASVDGSEFTATSWGGMFFAGRSALNRNPLMLLVPSMGILLLSMSFILLADALNRLTSPE